MGDDAVDKLLKLDKTTLEKRISKFIIQQPKSFQKLFSFILPDYIVVATYQQNGKKIGQAIVIKSEVSTKGLDRTYSFKAQATIIIALKGHYIPYPRNNKLKI